MEIKKCIKIYDNVLPFPTLSNLLRFANICKFEETRVGGGDLERVDFDIRKTYAYTLSPLHNELTNVHWSNLLHFYFKNKLNQYKKDLNIVDFSWNEITTIDILKYQDNGFYTWHVDHFAEIPRTMSCVLLLNNDYDGGNLCFRNPDGTGEWELEVKPNRMIIWPSNFLYPHTVKPVTKGTRYSVVAWAI
jgi:hypothetical protein